MWKLRYSCEAATSLKCFETRHSAIRSVADAYCDPISRTFKPRPVRKKPSQVCDSNSGSIKLDDSLV